MIAYFAAEEKVLALVDSLRSNGIYLYISIVAETELISFEGWTVPQRNLVKQFLKENIVSIPYTRDLIETTSQIRMNSKLKLPDAIIAATSVRFEMPLLTRDLKDFKKVKDLKVLTV